MRVELEKARNLRSRLEVGQSCVGAQASLIDPTVMENFGAAGFDGITGVVVGPLDLSIDLGVPGDFSAAPYFAAIASVREACREHGTPRGIGCASLEQAKEVVQPGDQLLLVGGDDLAIASEARRTVAALGGPLEAQSAQ
jgi:2-keto-3-deoxy-L-rhamnonate aldolase RhmA